MRYTFIALFLLPLLSSVAAGQGIESSPSCGDGISSTTHPKSHPQNFTNDIDSCFARQDRAQMYYDDLQNRKAYDSLRAYIESCPFYNLTPASFSLVTGSAVGLFQEHDTVWNEYREWLKRVLYNNPDSVYYCSDLRQYAKTFLYYSNIGNIPDLPDYRTTLSILTYLADSSHCRDQVIYDDNPNGLWSSYYKHWKDTVTDSIKTPFDSTLPSLDDIGAGFIRGFQRAVQSGEFTTYNNALGQLTATKNPFTDEIELHFTVTKPTVGNLEIYDALGRMLWSEAEGYLEPREHTVRIAASNLSSGTYYARIVTLQGEVKTCKLIKE